MRLIHADLWDIVNAVAAVATLAIAVATAVLVVKVAAPTQIPNQTQAEDAMTHYRSTRQLLDRIETLKRDIATLERENEWLRNQLEALEWKGDLAERGGVDLEGEVHRMARLLVPLVEAEQNADAREQP